MKVLRVLTRANGGGPVRHLGALERELSELGVESRFIIGRTLAGEVDAEADLRRAGARPERLAALRPTFSPPDVLAASRRLSRIVDEFEPDLIHTHTAVAGLAGRMAAPAGVPVVHTFHGHTLKGGYWGWLRRTVIGRTERWLAKRTDVIVTVADRVADELRSSGLVPRKGWATIAPAPDPLPPAPRQRIARAGLEIDPEAAVLLFAGRLEPVKGLDVLLEAMAAAAPDCSLASAVLVVCGTGREEARARRLARPLGERVRFLGWRNDLEIPLAAADILVLPSRNEGWPIALADAAAAGVPVVATDVGGCAELLRAAGHGLLVPPESPGALGDALNQLLGDSGERDRLGAAGMKWAASAPKPADAAKVHLRLYEALVAGQGTGPWKP